MTEGSLGHWLFKLSSLAKERTHTHTCKWSISHGIWSEFEDWEESSVRWA